MYHFVQYLHHFIFNNLVMTLVVSSLDNILMVLLISEVVKIGAMKPIFLFVVPLGGRGFVHVWAMFVMNVSFIY